MSYYHTMPFSAFSLPILTSLWYQSDFYYCHHPLLLHLAFPKWFLQEMETVNVNGIVKRHWWALITLNGFGCVRGREREPNIIGAPIIYSLLIWAWCCPWCAQSMVLPWEFSYKAIELPYHIVRYIILYVCLFASFCLIWHMELNIGKVWINSLTRKYNFVVAMVTCQWQRYEN